MRDWFFQSPCVFFRLCGEMQGKKNEQNSGEKETNDIINRQLLAERYQFFFFEVEGRFLYKFFEKAFIFIEITLK